MNTKSINENEPSLCEKYRNYFDIGAAINHTMIKTHTDLLKKHFNSVTAENAMKFESVHPEEGVYTFTAADQLADFAAQRGMKMRGHTLVWHNQTPSWVFAGKNGKPVDRETLLDRMKSHIDTVVNRYKDRIYGWDVVNEAIEDKDDIWLRRSPWLEQIGKDFIEKAFSYAHEADPDAILFYNDYNACLPAKRDKIFRLLKTLKEKDVPIHGFGLQGHWNLKGPSLEDIRSAIESYASLGLQLQITELDISVFDFNDKRTDLTHPTEEMLELQTKRYEEVFKLFREYKDVITAVTFWGAADDLTWLDNFPVRGRKNWPFVFDEVHRPKPSFWRIIDFVNQIHNK